MALVPCGPATFKLFADAQDFLGAPNHTGRTKKRFRAELGDRAVAVELLLKERPERRVVLGGRGPDVEWMSGDWNRRASSSCRSEMEWRDVLMQSD
ncbi:MAG TPA: hypothetical protein PK156_20055 [Polyangium sp.]|nr:hypothetical protein [Polyangium sp.]